MRASTMLVALALASGSNTCGFTTPHVVSRGGSSTSMEKPTTGISATTAQAKIDFTTQVRPMLKSRCQPCHFAGGTMYQRLPFDRPETIKMLGPKLFTRIKDENERRLIRNFLSQEAN